MNGTPNGAQNGAIAIPPKTQTRLTDLVNAAQALQGQIDGIVATLREVYDVPDAYQLRDVRIGFEAPTAPPSEADLLQEAAA